MCDKKLLNKIVLWVLAIYTMCCLLFYFIGGDQIKSRVTDTGDIVNAKNTVGELIVGNVVVQPFTIDAEQIESVQLLPTTFARTNSSTVVVQICRGEQVLWEKALSSAKMSDWQMYTVNVENPFLITPNEPLVLVIFSPDSTVGNAVSFAYGNTLPLSHGEVLKEILPDRYAIVNGSVTDGVLCFSISGRSALWIGEHFWNVALVGLVLVALWLCYCLYCNNVGRNCIGLTLVIVYHRYRFLFEQLVKRDFKTKYKRSILGMFWSFLNPLLIMLVQYVVFSTLFKSNIANYPVYLLSGIICFSFFSEVTSLTLTSIVGNAGLITKVYVPKYIYPISRALSSLVNFLISLIPLLIVLLLTKTAITPAILLLPYGILCLLMFSMGIALFLSAAMVFFRDVQFLWGVASMLWMYATPIFYPDTIVPLQYLTIYKLNPLFHMIKFIRTILIDGVSPSPQLYMYCFIFGIIPLILGMLFFKKTQDKFVLYL